MYATLFLLIYQFYYVCLFIWFNIAYILVESKVDSLSQTSDYRFIRS